MNFKKNKKYIFTFVVIFLFLQKLNAFSKNDFSFSIEPNFGFSYGKLGEYLFTSSSENRYMISSLDWNLKPAFEYGGDFKVDFKNLSLNAGIKSFLPLKCGFMYDSDYNSTIKTNFCTLENNINKGFDTFITISYFFDFKNGFSFAPSFQANFSYYDFSANNGSGYFGSATITGNSYDVSYNSPDAYFAKSVSGIDYKKETFYTFVGFILKFSHKKWHFHLGTYFSPYSYSYAIDYHRDERNISEDSKADYYLLERTINYLSRVKEELKIQYDLKSFFGITFKASFIYGGISEGLFATNRYRSSHSSGIFQNSSEWTVTGQPCGENIILFSFDLGCFFKF